MMRVDEMNEWVLSQFCFWLARVVRLTDQVLPVAVSFTNWRWFLEGVSVALLVRVPGFSPAVRRPNREWCVFGLSRVAG